MRNLPFYADGARLVQVYHRRVRAARRRFGVIYFCQAQKYRVVEHREAALAGYPVRYSL